MSARELILSRLRAAVVTKIPQLPVMKDWYGAHQLNEEATERIARLRAALEAVHTEVHDTTATGWPALLLRLASAKGLRNLLIGDNTPHGNALQAAAGDALQLICYDRSVEDWRDELFDNIDASLTCARSAIAQTGSLILWPDAAEPRLMSLVPPVHFVLLDTSKIHADFYQAITAEGWTKAMPTNALLISGPSKTADIQQTLAYGAHGPRELVVLFCHEPFKGASL